MVSSEDRLIECAWPAAAGDDQCVGGAQVAAVELDLSGSWVDAAGGVGVRLYAGGGQGGRGGFEQAGGDALVAQHPVVRLFAAAGEEVDLDIGPRGVQGLRGGGSCRARADDANRGGAHRCPFAVAVAVKAGSRIASMNHGASSGSRRPVRSSSAAPFITTCVVVNNQDTGRSARNAPSRWPRSSRPLIRASALSCSSRIRAAGSSFCAAASRACD